MKKNKIKRISLGFILMTAFIILVFSIRTVNETLSEEVNYIYFDLAAGNVTINESTYTGYVFKTTNGTTSTVTITGNHSTSNQYYVYQSNSANKATAGLQTNNTYVLPTYQRVKYNGVSWGDYITNHPAKSSLKDGSVDELIEVWGTCDVNSTSVSSGAAYNVGRQPTNNQIKLTGKTSFNMVIDNIWSSYQAGNDGGFYFVPVGQNNSLTLQIKGDNRFGNMHCTTHDGRNAVYNGVTSDGTLLEEIDWETADPNHTNLMTIKGITQDATLTVANVQKDAKTNAANSVIGGSDYWDHTVKLIFESGIIYAGSATNDFCTAIGGGGNGDGRVIINGGKITAVHSSTGTAIGGGCGTTGPGGYGEVVVTGGDVYAYSFQPCGTYGTAYSDALPVAIGGGSSGLQCGGVGIVRISENANVYAYAEVGTAIGGGGGGNGWHTTMAGNYYDATGGNADVTISGGIVRAISDSGTAIGGGGGGRKNVS